MQFCLGPKFLEGIKKLRASRDATLDALITMRCQRWSQAETQREKETENRNRPELL